MLGPKKNPPADINFVTVVALDRTSFVRFDSSCIVLMNHFHSHSPGQDSPDQKFVCSVWDQLYKEATETVIREPLLKPLIDEAVLAHNSFGDSLRFRLATKLGGRLLHSNDWLKVFAEAGNDGKNDAALQRDACQDLIAILKRDPACDSVLTAFLFFKGYKALQSYRFSHTLWNAGRRELAHLCQSRISEVFSVDIHPAARIGRGVMLDHATGLVIGETAVVGDDCSFLHGVTLGGTGKVTGDRHPKIGNNVVIGCNASILGNIVIGDNCKIGSGTIVVKSMAPGTTIVGTAGRVIEPKPTMDHVPGHPHPPVRHFSSLIARTNSSTRTLFPPLRLDLSHNGFQRRGITTLRLFRNLSVRLWK